MAELNFGILDTQLPGRIAAIPQQIQQSQMQNALQGLQMQHAAGQNELAKYQLSSAKRTDTEAEQLRNLFKTRTDYTTPEFVQSVYAISPEKGQTYAKALQEQKTTALTQSNLTGQIDKRNLDIKIAKGKSALETLSRLASVPGGATDAAIDAALAGEIKNGILDPAKAEQMAKQFKLIPLAERPLQLQLFAADTKDRLKALTPTSTFVNQGTTRTPYGTNALLPDYNQAVGAPIPVTTPQTPTDIQKYELEISQLRTAGVPDTDPRIAQRIRAIRNLHPGLAVQNVVGVDENGNQVVNRLPGGGGPPSGAYPLNTKPISTARTTMGLSEADNALLFGADGPVASGKIPIAKLTPNNAKMYAEAYRNNPDLNFASLTTDQIAAAATARTQGAGTLTTEQNAALYGPNGAITTGKLDPYKVNSRNAVTLANAYIAKPDTDMNKLAQTATIMRNPLVVSRAQTVEMVPELLANMAEAGKKVNFSHYKFIGEAQKFLKGQSNNPDFVNYMTQRNDLLLTLAGVMRGNGATDKAHQAEIEAASPTLDPKAFDAYVQGQMTALKPRLQNAQAITRSDKVVAPPTAAPATAGAIPPAAIAALKKGVGTPEQFDEQFKLKPGTAKAILGGGK